MNTLIEIKRSAVEGLKIVGDISKLNVLLEGEPCEPYILGFGKYITHAKITDINEICNGAISCGIVDARKLFKAGKIFVIKRKDNVGYILKCQKDGDFYCCFGTEFTNLQESSDYVFADTFEQAVDGYIVMKSIQLEMQDLTEQKQVKENDILTIDESYQVTIDALQKVNQHHVNRLEEALNCLEVADAKILELERKLRFSENQLKGQIQGTENLTEEIKKLQSNYLNVCENYKQKNLQCEALITENKNLIKTNTVWAQQINNHENTAKALFEENKKLRESKGLDYAPPENAKAHPAWHLPNSISILLYNRFKEKCHGAVNFHAYLDLCVNYADYYVELKEMHKSLQHENQQLKLLNNSNFNNPTLPKISDATLAYMVSEYSKTDQGNTFESWINNLLANLPKPYNTTISEGTLEKLVGMYNNSKKSINTFDSWLVDCVIESLKIMAKHPIDGDNLQYLQHCFEAHLKTASYTYGSLPAYLKQACSEFGKLEKIKAALN